MQNLNKNFVNTKLDNGDKQQLPFILQFAAGGIAGVSEILTMYPLDVIKTRLQLVQLGTESPGQSTKIIQGLRQIVQAEGFSRLYRGILSPLLVEAPKRATKFAANEFYSKMYLDLFEQSKMTQPLSILTGVSAGMTEACLVVSFELVKIRLQDRKFTGKYRGMADCIRKIYAEEGLLTFAKGLESTLWRHAMWNGGYFGIIHFVRSVVPKPGAKPHEERLQNHQFDSNPLSNGIQSVQSVKASLPSSGSVSIGSSLLHDFVCGAIGGTVGTILNTPFDVVKTRIQGHIGPHPKYRWAIPSLYRIWQEEGFTALFRGFKPKVIRLGPGGGILLVVYDRVTKFFQTMLYEDTK